MNRFAAAMMLLLVIGGIALANLIAQGPTHSQDPSPTLSDTAESDLHEFSYTQLQMAMPMTLTVWCDSEAAAQASCKLAFTRVSELVKIFSDYLPDSEVNQLLKSKIGEPQPVSRELFEVLAFSKQLHQDTDGAFDPSAGQLASLWRQARKTKQLPDKAMLRSAKAAAGFENITLNQKNQTVTLHSRDLQLDFGGVAKGYIGDQVIAKLRERNIPIAKCEAGGDIVVGAAPPNSLGWEINVTGRNGNPKALRLKHCGVSTSGDLNQFVDIDGIRYSHVLDPRSGYGVSSGRLAVVIAPSGLESDAIATSACILDEAELQRLVKLYDGVSAWSSCRTR